MEPNDEKVNILLVDDQPAKLLSYEVMLEGLGENLIKASSAREAFERLLKHDVGVILVDVCMPELDGFELASMIREHPRFRKTAIIFVSAVLSGDIDSLRGYEMGAVDYVSVPVVPAVLQAKVRVFVDLYRKTRQLERMNAELERRVAQRTSEVEAAMERLALLAREVDHRAKNALAVIQSIVSLTRAATAEAFSAAILGRIRAMARAHTLLSQSRWSGADLRRLVEEELAPYAEGERVRIEGGNALLPPNVAQTLAIAIHELATNAAKYGALSRPEGRVHVGWRVVNGQLDLAWSESGLEGVEKPKTSGFGTRVIDASIRSQLGGRLEFNWRANGLICHLVAPLRISDSADAEGATLRPMQSEIAGRGVLAGKRVLVVEDEAVVALMMAELLGALGARVVGPVSSLRDALQAPTEDIDVAVLDVNLDGEMVYPLAAALRQKKIPFILVTGYDAESVGARMPDAPVLQKPVEAVALKEMLLREIGLSNIALAAAEAG